MLRVLFCFVFMSELRHRFKKENPNKQSVFMSQLYFTKASQAMHIHQNANYIVNNAFHKKNKWVTHEEFSKFILQNKTTFGKYHQRDLIINWLLDFIPYITVIIIIIITNKSNKTGICNINIIQI